MIPGAPGTPERLAASRSPLDRLVREAIAADGPMTVRDYMALCLGHPAHGYYMTRDPFGAAGDFTTAPEISQMFGELIGLWAAETWRLMGAPDPVLLVELGPGRGTLMADALRAARAVPPFRAALAVHLVETSPVLRETQRQTLGASGAGASGASATWQVRLADVPAGPAIVLANEFFDALPIRQYVRAPGGWHERLVGLEPDGKLAFGLSGHPEMRITAPAEPGAVLEIAEATTDVVTQLATRLVSEGGAALALDYGHARTGFGDTLQALRRHAFVDPLAEPGEADLTAHVDFDALGRAAMRAGARVHGPVTQRTFLRALGIEHRAARLKAGTDPAGAAALDAALARLTGADDGQMGELFKVVGLSGPSLADLPGLPRATGIEPRKEPAC